MNRQQLPNAITALRIGLVPMLVWLLSQREYRAALAVVLIAGVSDALDGFLAKRYSWQTRLGGLLDPIADKLLLAAAFIGLWSAGQVPFALLALVLGRDLVIVSGAIAYQLRIGPVQPRPTRLGKLTTAVQIAFVVFVLLHLNWPFASRADILLAWGAITVVTFASGIDYVVTWSARARRARER